MLTRVWWAWDRFGWALVSAGFVVVAVLGLVGFSSLDANADSMATRWYLTLQLFTMDSGAIEGSVPWTLELARWAAPVVLAGAAAGTIATLIRRRTSGWAARRYSDHVVVVGLGERGWQVARRVREDDRRVVAIEIDPDSAHVGAARRLGIPVVLGDGGDVERLNAAGTPRASRLVVLTGDAGSGAEVARAVIRLADDPEVTLPDPFAAFVAVSDAEAAGEINALLDETADDASVNLEFFALDERAGPQVVDRWAALRVAVGPPPALVVVGDSVAARSVVAAAARQWEAHRRDVVRGSDRLEVAWVLPDEQAVAATTDRLHRWHPDLVHARDDDSALHLTFRSCPPADVAEGLAAALSSLPCPVGMVVLAEGDDADVLRAAAAAERLLRGTPAEVVALTGTARALVGLTAGRTRVRVFDLVDELCSDVAIAQGRLEAMARALHDGYLRQLDATRDDEERGVTPAHATWEGLSQELRTQNYAAARSLRSMLDSCGYGVAPLHPATSGVTSFPEDVVDELARAEHHRWFAAQHPGEPVPRWEDVDPVAVERSRAQIRRIPADLAAAALRVTVE